MGFGEIDGDRVPSEHALTGQLEVMMMMMMVAFLSCKF